MVSFRPLRIRLIPNGLFFSKRGWSDHHVLHPGIPFLQVRGGFTYVFFIFTPTTYNLGLNVQMFQSSVGFSGTPNTRTPYLYYSHTTGTPLPQPLVPGPTWAKVTCNAFSHLRCISEDVWHIPGGGRGILKVSNGENNLGCLGDPMVSSPFFHRRYIFNNGKKNLATDNSAGDLFGMVKSRDPWNQWWMDLQLGDEKVAFDWITWWLFREYNGIITSFNRSYIFKLIREQATIEQWKDPLVVVWGMLWGMKCYAVVWGL